VYQIIDGVSIIDLEDTVEQIDIAKKVLGEAAKENKSLLICATKKAVAARAADLARDINAHYITTKWLPGLLTNFNTISKNVHKLIELKRQKEAGEWGKYVKHETVALEKEIRKLERLYSGILHMNKIPDIMLVVDIKREKNAVDEAQKSHIPVIAIVDTNCNPDEVQYPIMLNDDTPTAVDTVLTELLETYKRNVPKAMDKEAAIPTPKIEDKDVQLDAEAQVEVEKKTAPAKKKASTRVKKTK
jgi:small subunit ribosomal protein S2